MGASVLVLITVIEILALVIVLAAYVLLITKRLSSISSTLGDLAGGVRAVEQDANLIGPGVTRLNRTLDTIANALPAIAARAEFVAGRR